MFQNILIATDDLPPVKHAIRYVAKLFPRSKFHLITVINTSIKAVPRTELVLEGLQKDAQKALDV
ncbi:MAG: universal stress protein, partial [Candidatus Thermoplasmatota archaeon]|nr:universal stress protein [Candidatus Thermoplasmatota archaeon]